MTEEDVNIIKGRLLEAWSKLSWAQKVNNGLIEYHILITLSKIVHEYYENHSIY